MHPNQYIFCRWYLNQSPKQVFRNYSEIRYSEEISNGQIPLIPDFFITSLKCYRDRLKIVFL